MDFYKTFSVILNEPDNVYFPIEILFATHKYLGTYKKKKVVRSAKNNLSW